jgi:DNA-binding NtrC family response regulator
MSHVEIAESRIVVLASADAGLRHKLRDSLIAARWQVREAQGGAEAIALLDQDRPAALLTDFWLPDLEVNEFVQQISMLYPALEHLRVDGTAVEGAPSSLRRHELLHVLRQVQAELRTDSAGSASAGTQGNGDFASQAARRADDFARKGITKKNASAGTMIGQPVAVKQTNTVPVPAIPDMIGNSEPMMEVARLIRLVAPRSTTVLIEGETGTGKEVVARALHRLSSRSQRPFAVLNCAAIPEALLESELFGHARGAFTGAVQSRTGRIEAADGGTLFLDEIGEMPLALQAKMLRFLECGELQRVGDNDVVRVDVRVIAATHQPLELRSEEGTFRLDLYHRLAVFPIDLPALRERREDIAVLAEHLLELRGKESPRKRLSPEALERLLVHDWPGNVRELGHVLERAAILADDNPEIGPAEIRVRRTRREPMIAAHMLGVSPVHAHR